MTRNLISPDRARRDLRWVFEHAPIVRDHWHNTARWIGPAFLGALRDEYASTVDGIPDALLQSALEQRRSGRYFEALLVALITAAPRLELLAHDLQVRDGQRTIGAFDLLLRDLETQAVTHLELAFKQYLHRGGDPAQAKHWVGPRGRDRLDRKTQHMQNHQLVLGASAAGRALLESMQITEIMPFALMAGRLFIHRDDFQKGRLLPLPPICSETPEMGWWCTERELDALTNNDASWRALPPNYAIAPLNADDCEALPAPDWPEVQRRVAGGHPCLVADVRDGVEANRGWIVRQG